MAEFQRRPPKKFHPEPFSYHQEVELEITSLTNMGQGLGRVDGWVVFVPFTIPGEKVRCRIYRNDKNFSEADLLAVLEPSPERRLPLCSLFASCGGCQYQHISYSLQRDWKRRQTEELLKHMAGLVCPVEPVWASPQEFHYRSKITPHFDAPQAGQLGPIGFLQHGSRKHLIDVPRCEIATEAINTKLTEVRAEIRADAARFKKGATLLLRDANGTVHTDPKASAVETVCGRTLQFLAGDFFQNNPYILDDFVRYSITEAAAGGARYLVDAYCGSGLFALAGAAHFQAVLGIEVSASAVQQATANAQRNALPNVKFCAGSAESIFSEVPYPGSETAILIDPPRAGSNEAFLEQLFAFSPQRVVYVSCNPATQMRDLRAFLAKGWRVTKVQPFDLFPQTKHLECVVTLVPS